MMSLHLSKFRYLPRTMLRLFSNESVVEASPVISAAKKNLSQSPWKMNFLVKLRAATLANIRHGAIPEELHMKEIMVTKGIQHKRMRIMGRGRTGFGYKRWSHVTLKVEAINFDEKIVTAESKGQKELWLRKLMVQELKVSPREYVLKKPEENPRRRAVVKKEE